MRLRFAPVPRADLLRRESRRKLEEAGRGVQEGKRNADPDRAIEMPDRPESELDKAPSPNPSPKSALYESPQDALKKVSSEFGYWTGNLTDTSLQMCYALIAANWLVFGSVNGILHSRWARLSLFIVLLALASSVVTAWVFSESMRKLIDYAESDTDRWEKEFKQAAGKKVPWPFTKRMEIIGIWSRWVKAGLTLLSGALLI